jgi:hypothetical protein
MTEKRKKLYATAATKYHISHPDADPISGHIEVNKTFAVPESKDLYAQIMDVYGDEITQMIAPEEERLADVEPADPTKKEKLKGAVGLNEERVRQHVRESFMKRIMSEAINLERTLEAAAEAQVPEQITPLIQDVEKAQDNDLRPQLKRVVLKHLKDLRVRLSKTELDKMQGARDQIDKADKEKLASVEPTPPSKEGAFDGSPGDPYTYDFGWWKDGVLYAKAVTKEDDNGVPRPAKKGTRGFKLTDPDHTLYKQIIAKHPKPGAEDERLGDVEAGDTGKKASKGKKGAVEPEDVDVDASPGNYDLDGDEIEIDDEESDTGGV